MNVRTPTYLPTITLGNLLSLVVMIVGGMVVVGDMRAADQSNAARIEFVQQEFGNRMAVIQKEFDEAMIETRRVRPEIESRLRAVENLAPAAAAEAASLRREISEMKVQMRDLLVELRKANSDKP